MAHYQEGDVVDPRDLQWMSDWNGYEVGYEETPVVGHYMDGSTNYYIDMEKNKVLESWEDDY